MSARAATALLLGVLILSAPIVKVHGAESASVVCRTETPNAKSGTHDGSGTEERIAWSTKFEPEAGSLARVFFAEANLGERSYVLLRGTNGDLRLNAANMKNYGNASCIFMGGQILVELHVAPQDRDVSMRIDRIVIATPGPVIATLCSSDDRVPSGDNRVGRLVRLAGMTQFPYCTAWRISNGAFLTAGHCAVFDPDGFGSGLPDGVLDMNGLVEFNVPASTATGGLVASAANDQFPIDLTSIVWRFDGEGTWTAEEDGKRIRLDPNSKSDQDRLFAVKGNNEIESLDLEGKPITTTMPHSLKRDDMMGGSHM